MSRRLRPLLAAFTAAAVVAAAPQSTVDRVRGWRTAHETEILRHLFAWLSLPNVAADRADIRRNADALVRMFGERRFATGIVPTPGSPVVFAERRAPGATRTVGFYFHYDGQPVNPREWTHSPPFSPVVVTGDGRTLTPDRLHAPIDGEWRVYGRSASDDKSPIIAFLSGVDALDALRIPLTSNVKVILEGDEEAGSPSLERVMREHGERIRGDVLMMVDGPRHPSGRATLFFGARGIETVTLTVYGPAHDLHSGNYGNWAPNPALELSRLVAGMKDGHGRILVPGFYDDVTPLTPVERRALDEIPDVEPALMKTFGFSRPETPDQRLEYRHNLPTLNINAMEAGGGVGGQGRTVIPAAASARLDLRLVKAIDPQKQFDRLVAYVRSKGYFLVDGEPDAATRAAHPLVARVTKTGGYPAGRTPMDVPIARPVVAAVAGAAGGPIVRLPTIGGSAPLYVFTDVLKVPTIGLSVVNFDNNQHGPNENLRIQNLWDAIDEMAALLTMGR